METWGAGAASVDGVAGTSVEAGAGSLAAVAIETQETDFKKNQSQIREIFLESSG